MDLKGISWVGNFYQKFEAMCLEVEEVMYQDTVKYVENQVQTVGSSVKRFYSDVMQDLLPPSSMEATKDGDSILPLDFYGNFGIYMKPKIGTKEKKPKTDCTKKVFEDQVKTANHSPDYAIKFPSLSNKSNLRTRKSSKRDGSTMKEKSGSVSHLDENQNRILPSNQNCQQRQYSAQNVEGQKLDGVSKIENRTCKDLNKASPVNENLNFHQEYEIATPRFHEVARTNFIEESQADTRIVREKIANILADGPSFNDLTNSLVEENAGSICKNDGVISRVESSPNWQVQSDEIDSGEDVLFSTGSPNGWNTEQVNEVDASVLSEMEILQQPDKANLDESCIVVNRDDFHFAPRPEGKSKSYKTKISNVFSPRKSSTRKQEYQQLALWPTVEDSKDGKRFRNPDESEWEIL